MQLRTVLLSSFGLVLSGVGFLWGMIATFRPDRLRDYEARITRSDRFGVRPAETERGLGIAITGAMAMLISLTGVVQLGYMLLSQLLPTLHKASLARPHDVSIMQPIAGACLVLVGAILFIAPTLLVRAFPRANPVQDPATKPYRGPTVPAKLAAVFPVGVGIWMIVAWFR